MRRALHGIDGRLDAVETETVILRATLLEVMALARRLREQRDEALADREASVRLLLETCADLARGPDGSQDPAPVVDYLLGTLRAAGYTNLADPPGSTCVDEAVPAPS